jgi:putative ABC transport system permease protein
MLAASLLLAMREIRRHLLRSVLTVLGIVIGVAAVVTMVTVGNGVTASVQKQIASLGANTLILVANTSGRQAGSGTPHPFTPQDVDAIRQQIGGITGAAGQANSNQTVTANGVSWQSNINGTSDEGLRIQAMSVTAGRIFTPDEESAGKSVCIIGETVRKNLYVDRDPIGTELHVGKLACPVIGLLKERGQGGQGNDQDDTVLMPLKMVQRQIVGNTDIYWMVLDPERPRDDRHWNTRRYASAAAGRAQRRAAARRGYGADRGCEGVALPGALDQRQYRQ